MRIVIKAEITIDILTDEQLSKPEQSLSKPPEPLHIAQCEHCPWSGQYLTATSARKGLAMHMWQHKKADKELEDMFDKLIGRSEN